MIVGGISLALVHLDVRRRHILDALAVVDWRQLLLPAANLIVADHDATDYFLYFATKNRTGIQKMKEAMWRVDESGSFKFSDATASQLTLPFTKEPDFAALKSDLVTRFTGHVTTVGDVEEFVLADTPFHTGHYKRGLVEVERDGGLTPIDPKPGRRTGTFADPSMKLRFL